MNEWETKKIVKQQKLADKSKTVLHRLIDADTRIHQDPEPFIAVSELPPNVPGLTHHIDLTLGTGGRHLVVGHSNSTPSMVELLGGKPGTKSP